MKETITTSIVSADAWPAKLLIIATPWDEENKKQIIEFTKDLAARTPKDQLRARTLQEALDFQFHCDTYQVSIFWQQPVEEVII